MRCRRLLRKSRISVSRGRRAHRGALRRSRARFRVAGRHSIADVEDHHPPRHAVGSDGRSAGFVGWKPRDTVSLRYRFLRSRLQAELWARRRHSLSSPDERLRSPTVCILRCAAIRLPHLSSTVSGFRYPQLTESTRAILARAQIPSGSAISPTREESS